MTMKMFIARILLIDMQLDQSIARICALHSLLLITHIAKEMEIVFEEMKMNLQAELDGDVPDDTDDMPDTNVIKLQNGLGQMKKRKRKAVIWWHNFNIEKEPEKHFKSHIMLFLPWRIEEKLRGNYMSYED